MLYSGIAKCYVVINTFQNYCEQDSPDKSGRRSQRGGNSKQRPDKASRAEVAREMGETVVTKKVRGFSDSEIRRFIKSYRKFGKTRSRYILILVAEVRYIIRQLSCVVSCTFRIFLEQCKIAWSSCIMGHTLLCNQVLQC